MEDFTTITSRELLNLFKKAKEANSKQIDEILQFRCNKSPSVGDFIEFAKQVLEAKFGITHAKTFDMKGVFEELRNNVGVLVIRSVTFPKTIQHLELAWKMLWKTAIASADKFEIENGWIHWWWD